MTHHWWRTTWKKSLCQIPFAIAWCRISCKTCFPICTTNKLFAERILQQDINNIIVRVTSENIGIHIRIISHISEIIGFEKEIKLANRCTALLFVICNISDIGTRVLNFPALQKSLTETNILSLQREVEVEGGRSSVQIVITALDQHDRGGFFKTC